MTGDGNKEEEREKEKPTVVKYSRTDRIEHKGVNAGF